MSENGNNTKRFYMFGVQVGQQVFQVRVFEDEMQCCPCGHDLFDLKYRVAHVKPPVLGVEPQLCPAPIYVCAKCGYEVTPTNPTKKESAASKVEHPSEAAELHPDRD